MSLLGARLTLASIAVLPVLLGLGVDYAIQYQARLEEDGLNRDGALRAADDRDGRARHGRRLPVLLLSPVPMVRGFGLVLMGGVLPFFFALSPGPPRSRRLAAARWRAGSPPRCAAPAI